MSAIILRLLDVPQKSIEDDFVLSNRYLKASHEQTYAYLASKGIDIELIRPLVEQRAAYQTPSTEPSSTTCATAWVWTGRRSSASDNPS